MLGALREMVDSHIDSPLLERMAAALFDGFYFGNTWEKVPEGEELLRKVCQKSPLRSVRASAQFSLAGLLMKEEESTAARKAEMRTLLEHLKKENAETSYGKRAEGLLFEAEHLQIGQEAPDFEATDADGKTFKLSDYRGKVVVIDFWGFW